jgi:tripartite-type tricarboxylate transporter receptor subunit TctC
VTGEFFKMMTGDRNAACALPGAPPALTDLIAGQVHVMFDNLPSSIEHIKAAGCAPLGVCSLKRLRCLARRSTVAELCRASRPRLSRASAPRRTRPPTSSLCSTRE